MNFLKTVTIATHSGSFHADEALAVFMLKQLFVNATIVRTRDPELIKAADIVVDVGAVYDASTHRYDHHQREFTTTFSDAHHVTKLSSAGLVYKHFGKQVLKKILVDLSDDSLVEIVYQKVYTDFVEGMDAIDNGVSRYPANVQPLYKESTNLSRRVSRLHPEWNDAVQGNYDERFLKAVELVGAEFTDVVKEVGLSWIPARAIVEEAINDRHAADKSGKIMILPRYCPWKGHLYNLEKECGIVNEIQYVLYSDESGKWRIQAVPVTASAFESRMPLPEAWRGLRDEELSTTISIPGCIFVHASGFIGGNLTKEGVLAMAVKAVSWQC